MGWYRCWWSCQRAALPRFATNLQPADARRRRKALHRPAWVDDGLKAGTVCGADRWVGGADGTIMAPARDTTADVVMPSPPSCGSFRRSDHSQAADTAATTAAMS